jgi:hypothetical protein
MSLDTFLHFRINSDYKKMLKYLRIPVSKEFEHYVNMRLKLEANKGQVTIPQDILEAYEKNVNADIDYYNKRILELMEDKQMIQKYKFPVAHVLPKETQNEEIDVAQVVQKIQENRAEISTSDVSNIFYAVLEEDPELFNWADMVVRKLDKMVPEDEEYEKTEDILVSKIYDLYPGGCPMSKDSVIINGLIPGAVKRLARVNESNE